MDPEVTDFAPSTKSSARGRKTVSSAGPRQAPGQSVDFVFGTAPAFVRWLPRVLTVLALFMLLGSFVEVTSWASDQLDYLHLLLWLVPLGPIDFVSSVVLILLAAALNIRKRAAWWTFVTIVGFTLAIIVLLVAALVLLGEKWAIWDYVPGAVLYGLTFAGLIRYRKHYTAKTQQRGWLKALAVLVLGIAMTVLILTIALSVTGGLTRTRVRQILAEFVGTAIETDSSWILLVLGLGLGASIILAFWTMLRSQQQAKRITIAEERKIRELLAADATDSLGYFGTRRDRSALCADGCGVTYRVEKGVCLVAGDPIGPPELWNEAARAFVAHAVSYGWVPAVLAASKQGARAYHLAGLKVLHVGDEAILHSRDFVLAAMPDVQRAVSKLTTQGYSLRIRRQSEIPADELATLAAFADEWRDGDVERGFSMALGRFGDAADGQCLIVEALFPESAADSTAVAGLLSFVPWGSNGVSLDVMRRNPLAENGVTEFLIAGLMGQAGDLGIASVSLNFAVFRSAFEQGKELGAGPVKQLWRNVLLFASRFWQLESLYRSNEKYHPEWVPRMLCYPDGSEMARIGLAVSIAEGFLALPGLFGRGVDHQPIYTADEAADLLDITPVEIPAATPPSLPDQVRHRLGVRTAMVQAGVEPYPAQSSMTAFSGRVLSIRDHGGIVFFDLRTEGRDTQLIAERDVLDAESYRRLRSWVSRGDWIRIEGEMGTSRTGTASFFIRSWTMAAKSLRPWPSLYQGLSDPETKVRRRYLDLTLNRDQRDIMVARSRVFGSIRQTLHDQNFLEVETPILQTIHGGANARPFLTHINAYHLDLYLRIAPELYLKRLLVGGFDRVFEMGRNFRNEGVDATHNPEFSMLEAYQAGGDYSTMRELTRTMVITAAQAALGTTIVRGRVGGVEHEIDLAEEWTTISLTEVVSQKLGVEVTTRTDVETMRRHARAVGIEPQPRWAWGTLLQEIYEKVAESSTVTPTFYTDFPAETSPLTRQHREDPLLAEKWDLIIFGSELGTAYTELVDPVVQRERLTAQSLAAAGGNPEAMQLDEDFLLALEHGMPPAGGMGMGLDRLVMLLTDQTIRSTIAFPLAKPKNG